VAGFVLANYQTKEGTVEKNEKAKKRVIEELMNVPIVLHACKSAGVARSTYYRWINEDKLFANDCDDAMKPGIDAISDIAEVQLINAIKQGDHKSIVYWLRHHKETYSDRKPVPESETTWMEILQSVNEYRRKKGEQVD